MFLVLGRQAQIDGVKREIPFPPLVCLVSCSFQSPTLPRLWQIRHPGPVIGGGESGSLNGEMALILLLGAVSFTVFITGHVLMSMRITSLEQRLERIQEAKDEV